MKLNQKEQAMLAGEFGPVKQMAIQHQIKVGDGVQAIDYMSHHIVSIEELPVEDTQTYIFTVENNHNFYANGILTHNK